MQQAAYLSHRGTIHHACASLLFFVELCDLQAQALSICLVDGVQCSVAGVLPLQCVQVVSTHAVCACNGCSGAGVVWWSSSMQELVWRILVAVVESCAGGCSGGAGSLASCKINARGCVSVTVCTLFAPKHMC
jgi:hypothetical protein